MPLGIPHSRFLSWSDTDRGYALAWQVNKRATCPGCGTRADEWDTDEDAYISDHTPCEGCARLAEEQANNLDKLPDGTPRPGQRIYLTPRELYEAKPPGDPADGPRQPAAGFVDATPEEPITD